METCFGRLTGQKNGILRLIGREMVLSGLPDGECICETYRVEFFRVSLGRKYLGGLSDGKLLFCNFKVENSFGGSLGVNGLIFLGLVERKMFFGTYQAAEVGDCPLPGLNCGSSRGL